MPSDVEGGGEAVSAATFELDEFTRDFWGGGADGVLLLASCVACNRYVHPKGPICPYCWTTELVAAPVSGNATIYTWTVNRHPWPTGPKAPYVPAVVELPEQDDLFLLTAIREDPADERFLIGAPVTVDFERLDEEHFLPVFRFTPAPSSR